MRPGQQNKRGRGRGNNNNNNNNGGNNNFNRKGSNPLTRTYDSSGPDIKIRGTAQHIAEKYAALARDAQSSGDRVMAENYLQHAEHYNRIIAAAQAQMQERFQRDDRNDYADRDSDDMDAVGNDMDDAAMEAQPVQAPAPQQPQPRRQHNNERQHAPRQTAQAQPQPPQPQPAAPVAAAPEPVAATEPAPEPAPAPAPVIDGSGPQPVIEGTPAEVAIEAEEAAAPRAKTPRRRTGAATRPRRQPRRAGGEEAAEGEASCETPALEAAGSE